MKIIISLCFLICGFCINDQIQTPIVRIIEINIDSSNFKKNVCEKDDLTFLGEIKNVQKGEIALAGNKILLTSLLNTKQIDIKPTIYFYPQYDKSGIKEKNIRLKPNESIF